jgi:hypothetical protein
VKIPKRKQTEPRQVPRPHEPTPEEREAAEDRADIAAAKEALKEPGRIPFEHVKAELGLK